MSLPMGAPREGQTSQEGTHDEIAMAEAAKEAMIGKERKVQEGESLNVYTGSHDEQTDLGGPRRVLTTLEGGDRFIVSSFGVGADQRGTPQELVFVKLVTDDPEATGFMLRFEMGSKSTEIEEKDTES